MTPVAPLTDMQISLFSPLVPATAPAADAPEGLWGRILDELLRLRGLPDDWDGQGAQALDRANADAAIRWIHEMRCWRQALPPTRVVPGTTGEVVLEWREDAFLLAAEIATPGCVEWLLELPGQPIKQWETDAGRTWIVRSER